MFYKMIGRGTPLIFLHGGFGMDHSYFLPYVKPLVKKFRLVFFDFRGNGRSDDALSETYSYDQFVEDVKKIIKRLKFKKVFLLGHSAGGFIALKFALKHPKILKGIILTDTFPGGLKFKKGWQPSRFKSTYEFKNNFIKDLLGAFRPKNRKLAKKILEKVIYRKDVYERLARYESPRFDVRKELYKIKLPTLIIVGKNDVFGKDHRDRFLKGAKIMTRIIPNSQLKIIKDSGHFPFIEKPVEFNKIVENFLKQ